MKAIILNSGIGKRMGDFTRTHHKSMAVLKNGETIFERQLRILRDCGIRDFVVTVGPFADQLKEKAAQTLFSDCRFTWVANPCYAETNYIYSLFLARDSITSSDSFLMHGDLVFCHSHINRMLSDPRENLGTIQPDMPLPEKDFKAQIADNRIRRISVNVFGDDCVSFQPLYKLSQKALLAWMDRINTFIEAGKTGVYAEEALNEISDHLCIEPFVCGQDFIGEVDNLEDLDHAGKEIELCDFRNQAIIHAPEDLQVLTFFPEKHHLKKLLLLAGNSLNRQPFGSAVLDMPADLIRFSDFTANPDYEEVLAATDLFLRSGCDGIVAVGGGSAIDIAKCVKLFAAQLPGTDLLQGPYVCSHIPMLAIPTTAGTGSESTHFSVVYVNGIKHSVQHDSMLPEEVLLLPAALTSLPDYQKKSTFLDAVCHGVESMWSVRATEESRHYAEAGLQLLLENMDPYFAGDSKGAEAVILGANYCGRAINLSQTTAAHAMCYSLTKQLHISHGHAAALCLQVLFPYMLKRYRSNPEDAAISATFPAALKRLQQAFGSESQETMEDRLLELLHLLDAVSLDLETCDASALAATVNAQRLSNHPIRLTGEDLTHLYEEILTRQE